MSKPIVNVALDGIVPQQGADSDHDEYPLQGDLTIGGAKLINGVRISGPSTLFDYLDSGLKD